MRQGIRIGLAMVLAALPALSTRNVLAQRTETSLSFIEQSSTDAAEQAFAEARALVDENNWRAAETKLRRFVEQYQKNRNAAAALYYLALVLKKQNRFAEASRTVDRALRDFPQSSWTDDARKLRLEIASLAGDGRALEAELEKEDLESKVIALQGLFISNPDRALQFVVGVLDPESKSSGNLKEAAVSLLGQQTTPESLTMLISLARSAKDVKVRRLAVFWLGRWRDKAALEELKSIVQSGDEETVQMAVAAIAQNRNPDAGAFLRELAGPASPVEARKRAIFWIGQRHDDESVELLFQIYDREKDESVKQRVIMALALQRSKRSLRKLIDIAKHDPSIALRKQAVFWLGNSRDPEATKFLEEILDLKLTPDK